MMNPHRNTRRMTLKKYGLYMADMMGRDPQWGEPFMPPAPTNIRDGYEEYSYHRQYATDRVEMCEPSTVEEGTDNTPRPTKDLGAGIYREYYTHKVEKICNVKDTHELREWLEGCYKYGFPSVYYG